MEDKSMTARICAFARAYHSEHNKVKIFDDSVAKKLLTQEEINTISENMTKGIMFFNPSFKGSNEEALRFIVDHKLSETPLARAAFTEKSLEVAVAYGASQYLILGAGFDTFAYRKPKWADKLKIFEIDHPLSLEDKRERLDEANLTSDNVYYIGTDFCKDNWDKEIKNEINFDTSKCSFCSMLGLIYYLSKEEFEKFIEKLSNLISVNSSIVFDYPNEDYFKMQNKHSKLADAANEKMKACYSYEEMEKILEKNHLLIFEHLDAEQMTSEYFMEYNKANPKYSMQAQKNVNYCLCVKK